jgi:hypothetical protein
MTREDRQLLSDAKNHFKTCEKACYLGSVIDLAERLAEENQRLNAHAMDQSSRAYSMLCDKDFQDRAKASTMPL